MRIPLCVARSAVAAMAAAGLAAAPAGLAAAQPAELAPPPLVDPAAGAADGSAGVPARLAAAATAGAPFVHQVVEIVNEERLANGGLPPLKAVDLLDTSAGGHSTRMAIGDFFAHCDLDTGTDPADRMTAAGYSWNAAGENIAAGSPTPEAVMALWMASLGHRNNILGIVADYREIGVGHASQPGDAANIRRDLAPAIPDCTADSFGNGPFVHYWTQNFGRRDTVYPVVVEREAWETSCAEVDLYTYGAGELAEMRFSNDGVSWSAWMPFASELGWTLDPQAVGTATVFSELRNGGTVRSASDTIELADDYPAVSSVDLSADTVVGVESWTACDTITAGDGFHVAVGGDATFTAATVILGDGFSVADGGELRVVTP